MNSPNHHASRSDGQPVRVSNAVEGERRRSRQDAFDVRWYDLDLELDPERRYLIGRVIIRARACDELDELELDLDSRFDVTSVDRVRSEPGPACVPLSFEHCGDRLRVQLPDRVARDVEVAIAVSYRGEPQESMQPPFDGGFTWGRTAAGEPWIGVSVQLGGARLWWPCKDCVADKPDDGVSLHITAPAGLTVVSNGRRGGIEELADGRRRWHWNVSYPINVYNVTLYVAPFVELEADYVGVDGASIPFSFFVPPEDADEGRRILPELVSHLAFLERTFGPYPFRKDKYAFVLSPYIGMEHQSAIAYGRAFDARIMGFLWIALHEASHEWWGNLVTAADWQDFWLHEGFAKYTEALYAGHLHGSDAYHEYLARFVRPRIENDLPLAPSTSRAIREMTLHDPKGTQVRRDPYDKGAMVLHTLRYLVGEAAFAELLRRHAYPDPLAQDGKRVRLESSDGFAKRAEQVSGRDLAWFFEVYLRQTALPHLHIERSDTELLLRWEAPAGLPFPMPVEVEVDGARQRIDMPDSGAAAVAVPGGQAAIDPDWWILRDESPDPDRFGTLGCRAVSLDAAIQAGRTG